MMQDSQVSATTLQMRDEEDHIRRIFDEVRQTSPVQLRRSVIYRGLPGSENAQLRRRGYRAGSIRANAFISSTIHGGSAIGEGDGTTTASLSNQPFKRSQTSMKRCSWRSESTRRNDPRIGG